MTLDGSDSDSEMSIISEGKSDKEDHNRVTVDTDSFKQVRGQLGRIRIPPQYPCKISTSYDVLLLLKCMNIL